MNGDRAFWWRDGQTFDVDGRERMYLHFHRLKRTMAQIDFTYADAPDAFRITRDGMFA